MRILVFVFAMGLAGPAFAQECSQDVLAQARSVRDIYEDASRALQKAGARINLQALRIAELPEAVASDIQAAPAMPTFDDARFDDQGMPVLDCDEAGEALTDLVALEDAVSQFAADVDSYRIAIESRNAALDNAETAVASGAEGDGQASGEMPGGNEPDVDGGDGTTTEADTPDAETATEKAPVDDEAADPNASDPGGEDEQQSDGIAFTPMSDPSNPNMFRRVLTLPDAQLYSAAGESAPIESEVPTFTVLYVFDESRANGSDWLQVGQSLRDRPTGWLKSETSVGWSTMLVMQFAPRGRRSQALFFRDGEILADIVNGPFFEQDAADYYAGIEAERRAASDDPSYVPSWDPNLVAIEPQTAAVFEESPYILPILDWQEETFDGRVDTVLLEVAALPASTSAGDIGDADAESFVANAGDAAAMDDEFRVGLAFVADTTVSMGPFIERIYQTIETFYDSFGSVESNAYVDFALVGFRDNIERDPEALEYVTRVFQPLDVEAPRDQVLANMRLAKAAAVPTLDFKEDVFAGVHAAIHDMDWDPYDARIIVLVTDASARAGEDPLAQVGGLTPDAIAEAARQRRIAIIPIHLMTTGNEAAEDRERGRSQYMQLSQTGDVATEKYIAIDGSSDEAFAAELEPVARQLAFDVLTANSGAVVQEERLELVPDEVMGAGLETASMSGIISNEIFRAQLESLASVGDGAAPAFLSGWAADRDLTDPNTSTLEVSVFLTRNQLSTLGKRLEAIVDAYRSGGEDPATFFDRLQTLAAQTATDPNAPQIDSSRVMAEILPSFLSNLPYRSDILKIDAAFWAREGQSSREEKIESLAAKLKIYEDTFNQTDLWIDFGAGDPGLEATPIRLTNLP